jgi:hypothetical protein
MPLQRRDDGSRGLGDGRDVNAAWQSRVAAHYAGAYQTVRRQAIDAAGDIWRTLAANRLAVCRGFSFGLAAVCGAAPRLPSQRRLPAIASCHGNNAVTGHWVLRFNSTARFLTLLRNAAISNQHWLLPQAPATNASLPASATLARSLAHPRLHAISASGDAFHKRTGCGMCRWQPRANGVLYVSV